MPRCVAASFDERCQSRGGHMPRRRAELDATTHPMRQPNRNRLGWCAPVDTAPSVSPPSSGASRQCRKSPHHPCAPHTLPATPVQANALPRRLDGRASLLPHPAPSAACAARRQLRFCIHGRFQTLLNASHNPRPWSPLCRGHHRAGFTLLHILRHQAGIWRLVVALCSGTHRAAAR